MQFESRFICVYFLAISLYTIKSVSTCIRFKEEKMIMSIHLLYICAKFYAFTIKAQLL